MNTRGEYFHCAAERKIREEKFGTYEYFVFRFEMDKDKSECVERINERFLQNLDLELSFGQRGFDVERFKIIRNQHQKAIDFINNDGVTV